MTGPDGIEIELLHQTDVRLHFLTCDCLASEFAMIAPKLRRATEYVYLHLMGEPLCHPELAKIIDVAAENGLSALPPASDVEPDFSDPQRMPMLVEVDEAFLQG